MTDSDDSHRGAQIAVIGMAGRFPGARNVAEYWQNLARGVESVKFFSEEELLAAGESPEKIADPAYVRAWPVLDDIDLFDSGFFGMSPRDAAVMDPQHRLFLETAWSALEHAGYSADRVARATGVFAACGMNTYMMYHLVTNQEVMESVGEWLVRHTGNDMNFLATRVSYQMNLKGPSMNVQTACSSSLVAVHLACQSLLNGECDLALAGASTLSLPQDRGYLFKPGEILSPDGHCRPFDAGSRGTLFGSGSGCVVLKRMTDALADGDNVLAVILGSAINNDGAGKVGYLAPSVDGQAGAISEALAISGIEPATISYIEAHGTGTAVGDPIEIAALTQAYQAPDRPRESCAIGSVKANIGHLGEAAGMAGLIKVVLALQEKKLPPSINFETTNPEIPFEQGPFFVNTRLQDWKADGPRRAALTALGAGGTNAHLILEEPPEREASAATSAEQLLVLSAKTASALERASHDLATHLEENPHLSLADVAYTLQIGRKHFHHRRSLACESTQKAAAALRSADPKQLATRAQSRTAPKVVFMFPGGGAQYAGMGAELYGAEPAYRQAFDECLASIAPELGAKLRAVVFVNELERAAATRELERPSLALPALFATEYAMAKLLMSWGLVPAACIGHSMGEVLAACLAGVFSVREGMALVVLRGRLFESLAPGGMLSVQLPEAELLPLLGPELSIAAANAPGLCVASGPVEAIEALEGRLEERGLESTRIHINVAAHSTMVTPILAEFERFCRTLELKPPSVPFVSNLTGTWITPEELRDPTYWVRHLRSTVRFGDGVAELLKSLSCVLVEVGPGRTLSSLARQQTPSPLALPTLRHPQECASDRGFLLATLGRLWTAGIEPDFAALHEGTRRARIPLPTYSFERQRHWIAAGQPGASAQKPAGLRKQHELETWFRAPTWKRSPPPALSAAGGPWLVFCDAAGVGDALAPGLSENAKVVRVSPGEMFMKAGDDRYIVRPTAPADFEALFDDLALRELFPRQIVYGWAISAERSPWSFLALGAKNASSNLSEAEGSCFFGLLFLAQVLGTHEKPVTLSVLSNGLHRVDASASSPEKALLLGPTRVIPREFPFVFTRSIDLTLPKARSPEFKRLVASLVAELKTEPDDRTVALRASGRWVQSYEPLPLPASSADTTPIRHGGVFVITGGLGGIGLEVAEHLARTAKAKLVLVGRTGLPPREEWPARLAEGGSLQHRIAKVQAIEALGGEVLAVAADVTLVADLENVLSSTRQRFGEPNGVIHSAGLIDDGLISLKTPEAASAVLAVKTRGVLALDQVFGSLPLDFFVLFSSVSSILGLEGQIDYTAANAFLDAFAEAKAAETGQLVIAIGWSAWQEIGMAVSLAEQVQAVELARSSVHPCLERVAIDNDEEVLFVTSFSRRKHWLLAEHVVHGGEALIPGTGYLELARAGLAHDQRQGTIEIRDVTFLAPFVVQSGHSRELRLRIRHSGPSQGEFAFFTRSEGEPHVTGSLARSEEPPPPALELATIRARLNERERVFNGFLEQSFMDFGPRWANVERIRFGVREALISLRLPEAFELDLSEYSLHPALLDMATGGAQALIDGFDPAKHFFVPFAYGRVTIFRPFVRSVHSHVRYRPNGSAELALFDVTICDDHGNVLVEIVRFTMKRVARAADFTHPEAAQGDRSSSPTIEAEGPAQSLVGGALRQGIANAEGVEAFSRILCARLGGQIVASSVSLEAWLADVDARARPVRAVSPEATGAAGEGFARPTLSGDFVPPRNEIERELAAIWRELLGLADVGVRDDFFELGGQSLVAVRLFNKIRKRYGVSLPLSTLFEAPTIEGAARIIAEELGIELRNDDEPSSPIHPTNGHSAREASPSTVRSPSSVPPPSPHAPASAQPPSRRSPGSVPPPPPGAGGQSGSKRSRWASLVIMQPKGVQPPFFCVAGLGGTLNNLRKLAIQVGDQRPFYGLQPPGADDPSKLLYSVEELAEHYLKEVKAVQPRGPYWLGGYSGGGITAYEMCRRLTAQGDQVAFLGFIDSYSPSLPERTLVERGQIHWRRLTAQGPRYLLDTLHRRVQHERYEFGRKLSRRLRGVLPEEFRYEQVQDSWLVAQGRYQPPSWDGSATLFRARELGSMSLWTGLKDDDEHGWGRYLRGGVRVELCPGDHNTMCEEPNVRVLAAKLRQALQVPALEVVAPTPPASLRL